MNSQSAGDRKHENAIGGTAPGRRIFKLVATVLLIGVVAYFLGKSIAAQWTAIRAYPWRVQPLWLILSALMLWVDFIVLAALWRYFVSTMSRNPLQLGTAFRILVLSNLGKYIPGKVWTVMGMVYFVRREGHSVPAALASTVLHQAFVLLSGFIFVLVVLGKDLFGNLPLFSIIGGALLSIIILYPPLFTGIINWGLGLLKREPITMRLTFFSSSMLFLVYVVVWILYGAGFWCMLRGAGISAGPFWQTGASFAAAYLLGFLVLFAPGGLGVREGVLAVLLTPTLGPGLAAVIAVVARLWMTVVELTELIPLAFGWGRLKSPNAKDG